MNSSRLDQWKEDRRILTCFAGANDDLLPMLQKVQDKAKDADQPDLSTFGLIEASKELIYDKLDGKPIFHMVIYSFDVEKAEISLGPTFNMLVGDVGSPQEVEEHILSTLATAAGLDVPVYPNTPELEPELARYHRKMLIEGFTAPSGDGGRTRLKLVKSPGAAVDSLNYLTEISSVHSYSPADLILMKDAVVKELDNLRGAQQVLSSLDYAVNGLTQLLQQTDRVENELQSWLTENPILFGTDYRQVIPKHRLGSEFEMDYALVRYSGLVDLVEIEASNLPLFNKSGDPSRYLVHAEQQVLDWVDWIEDHGPYARANLPGVVSPKAYVVIGKSSSLTDVTKAKLRRRNVSFGGRIETLTYDDLLERAINLRCQLLSLHGDA